MDAQDQCRRVCCLDRKSLLPLFFHLDITMPHFAKCGMAYSSIPELRPSLWRTCRALANRHRLKMLAELFRRPNQQVNDIAILLRISVAVASQYLRHLNARGLLHVHRVGSRVLYEPGSDPSVLHAPPLLSALHHTLRTHPDPISFIFRQVTAFTHPRRVQLIAVLGGGKSLGPADLARKTGISLRAVHRHTSKLVHRGVLKSNHGKFCIRRPTSKLSATLLRMAQTSIP